MRATTSACSTAPVQLIRCFSIWSLVAGKPSLSGLGASITCPNPPSVTGALDAAIPFSSLWAEGSPLPEFVEPSPWPPAESPSLSSAMRL